MHTGNLVVAFALAVQDRLEVALRGVGLDGRELAALTLVGAEDGGTVDWLCARVGLTHSGTVRLVDRLAARGLLRRGAAAGRRVPLHLTEKGRALLDRWSAGRDRVAEELLAPVPKGDRAVLVAALA